MARRSFFSTTLLDRVLGHGRASLEAVSKSGETTLGTQHLIHKCLEFAQGIAS